MGWSNTKLSDELIENIRSFYNQGNTCGQTAKKFGVGKTTVKSYVDVRPRKILTEEQRKKNSVVAVSKRRAKIKAMAIDYKGGKCVKCGYSKYIGALQFHHLNPEEKDFAISDYGHCRSWEKVKEELNKCILVCANCHSEIHGNMLQ